MIIEGNYIGLNAAGAADLGNSGPGVVIEAAGSPTEGARDNFVGVIGGAPNVISGNDQQGVVIRDSGVTGNVVANNYIGLNAAGSMLIPNAREGVLITSGAAGNAVGVAGAGNVIAGTLNPHAAVAIDTSGNTVQGNLIGTDATGAITLGGHQGVKLTAAGNSVGGKNFGDGNTIRGMTTEGIDSVVGNVFLGNSIFNSGALGIDNDPDGVTVTILPVIDLAVVGVALTRIGGVVNAAANTTYRVELFSSPTADDSGFGEGETYLGFTTVTTDDDGMGRFKFATPTLLPVGALISATTTLEGVGTSEFSQTVAVRESLVVRNTNDSGVASLRDAIEAANLNAGGNLIEFDIPGPGPHTIGLGSPLTAITGLTVIDGRSEPSFVASPVVEVAGTTLPSSGVGFNFDTGSDGSMLIGLSVIQFGSYGVAVGAADVSLLGNYLGVASDGTPLRGNFGGVSIIGAGARRTIIGGGIKDRNVISGNDQSGIRIEAGASETQVVGNYIGTNASGDAAMPNFGGGVFVISSPDTRIIGNTISGNNSFGVRVTNPPARNAVIQGNFIGVDPSGTFAVPNASTGVVIFRAVGALIGTDADGVNDDAERNVISANGSHGVSIGFLGAEQNVVAGNYIGTNAMGSAALGNAQAGISISTPNNTIGGPNASARNVISGNEWGVLLASANDNKIFGNYIGLNASGTAPLANTFRGVAITAGSTANFLGTDGDGVNDALEGNIIAGNSGLDLEVDAAAGGNVIAGNLFGTDATGLVPLSAGETVVIGSPSNRVGTNADGTSDAAERNVFASTIRLEGSSSTFAGNLVGVGRDESTLLGSPELILIGSFHTIGGGEDVERNFFVNRVLFDNTDTNLFLNNYVGVLPDGVTPNSGALLELASGSAFNSIGGGVGNVISRVRLTDAGTSNNIFESNLIGVNAAGDEGLGIDAIVFLIEDGASGNIVGTSTAGNVISSVNSDGSVGAAMHGVVIRGAGTDDNHVRNNFIGLNAAGDQVIGNNIGVRIGGGAARTTLGGPGANNGNVIAGNIRGVYLDGSADTQILTNRIGVDRSGRTDLGNHELGILVVDSSGTILRQNLVSGNDAGGIQLGDGTAGLVNGATILGNTIGANIDGAAPLGNANLGIRVAGAININIGGPATADRNVISGNMGPGVFVDGSSFTAAAVIQNNYIGVNKAGAGAIPNNDGVKLTQAGIGTSLLNNVISGNAGSGIAISGVGAGVAMHGNIIGLNTSGTIDLGNLGHGIQITNSADHTIGGAAAAQRNVISGNNQSGIVIFGASSTGNVVQGNFIGADVTGTVIRGNSQSGIVLATGAASTVIGADGDAVDDAAEGNVIVGNGLDGIRVAGAANTTIAGNRIGSDATGNFPFPIWEAPSRWRRRPGRRLAVYSRIWRIRWPTTWAPGLPSSAAAASRCAATRSSTMAPWASISDRREWR